MSSESALERSSAKMETYRLPMRDGSALSVRRFTPAGGTPRRELLIVHGGCEHGGRYLHVASKFAAAGYGVIVPDLRGHGESEGIRTDIRSIDQYLDDLQWTQRELLQGRRADVLLGHSFGGLLAIRLSQLYGLPSALVVTAPLLGLKLHVPKWKLLLGNAVARMFPTLRFRTNIDSNNMTRDPEFLAKRRSDPLLQREVTVRWFFAMQGAMQAAHRDVGRLTGPFLAFQGAADKTVDPGALERFFAQVPSPRKELVHLPNHVHEILNEADWFVSVERIRTWLDDVLPKTP